MSSVYYMSTAVAILKTPVSKEYQLARGLLAYAQTLKSVLSAKNVPVDANCLDVSQLEDMCGIKHTLDKSSSDWSYTHAIQEMRNELSEGDDEKALCQLIGSIIFEKHDVSYCKALMTELIETYANNLTCPSWTELLKLHTR